VKERFHARYNFLTNDLFPSTLRYLFSQHFLHVIIQQEGYNEYDIRSY